MKRTHFAKLTANLSHTTILASDEQLISEVITVDIVEAGAPNIDEVLLVLLYIMQCGFSGYQIFRLWISPHCTN